MTSDSSIDYKALEERFQRLRGEKVPMSGSKKKKGKGAALNLETNRLQHHHWKTNANVMAADLGTEDDGVLDDQVLPATIVAPIKPDGSPSKVRFTLPPESIPVHEPIPVQAEVDKLKNIAVGKSPISYATMAKSTAGNAPVSYATMVQAGSEKKKVNFRKLEPQEVRDDVDVVLPKESVREVNDRFQNTLVGYFLGNRLAYPVVESFVKNNWNKYGLSRVMMNGNGFFFFKFNDNAGMNKVLETGPWMIRSVPLLLNKWSPAMSLKKEDIKNIVVWIKLFDVPMVAYTEDGLSLLASKLGNRIILDSYTNAMCLESWGRSNFARTLIDVSADHDFKDELLIAIPNLEGEGYSKERIRVEYEWKPPKCNGCCIFGHNDEQCPIKSKVVQKPNSIVIDDGFQEVTKKAKKGAHIKHQKPNLVYRPVSKQSSSDGEKNKQMYGGASCSKVYTTNQFDILDDYGDDSRTQHTSSNFYKSKPQSHEVDDFDIDIDEHIVIEEDTPVSNG